MHATQSTLHTSRRPRKWYSGAVVLLMSAAISLAACDTGTSDPVVVPDADAPAVTEPTVAPVETEPTVEPVQEGEGVTDTEGVTEGEVVTDTEGTQQAPATTGDTGQATEGAGVPGAADSFVRASALLDYDFENIDGEVSGDLEDLLVDLSNGRILFTSIEYGGILDLGDKDIMVPLNAFVVGPDGELVLNIDENMLEQFPEVETDDWTSFDDPTWDDQINNFWNTAGVQPGFDVSEASQTIGWMSEILGNRVGDATLADAEAPAEPAAPGTVTEPNFSLGGITDVLVNLSTGEAKYALIDYGAGLDGEMFVLPLSAFDMTNRVDGLMYAPNINPELLQQAPRFDASLYTDDQPIGADFGETVDSWWSEQGFD